MMLMLLLLLDLGIGVTITTTAQHQTIGESGEEESEDEWNYVKVDKKLEGLTVVEEQSEPVIESPFGEERATEDFTQFELHAEQQQASEIAEIVSFNTGVICGFLISDFLSINFLLILYYFLADSK